MILFVGVKKKRTVVIVWPSHASRIKKGFLDAKNVSLYNSEGNRMTSSWSAGGVISLSVAPTRLRWKRGEDTDAKSKEMEERLAPIMASPQNKS